MTIYDYYYYYRYHANQLIDLSFSAALTAINLPNRLLLMSVQQLRALSL